MCVLLLVQFSWLFKFHTNSPVKKSCCSSTYHGMRYLRRKNVSGAHDARKIAFAKVQTAALSFLLIHPEKSERCEHSNMLENIISDWEHGGRTTDRWYNTEQKSFCTHKCSVKCCTPGNRPRQDKARSLSLSANTSQNT